MGLTDPDHDLAGGLAVTQQGQAFGKSLERQDMADMWPDATCRPQRQKFGHRGGDKVRRMALIAAVPKAGNGQVLDQQKVGGNLRHLT